MLNMNRQTDYERLNVRGISDKDMLVLDIHAGKYNSSKVIGTCTRTMDSLFAEYQANTKSVDKELARVIKEGLEAIIQNKVLNFY